MRERTKTVRFSNIQYSFKGLKASVKGSEESGRGKLDLSKKQFTIYESTLNVCQGLSYVKKD